MQVDNCDIIITENVTPVAMTLTNFALFRAVVCQVNGSAVFVNEVAGCALCLSTTSVDHLFPSEGLFFPVRDAVYFEAVFSL